jgi:hypothetical protein
MARPERFDTRYDTAAGVLWVYAETYFVLIRLSDGLTKRIEYSEIGL